MSKFRSLRLRLKSARLVGNAHVWNYLIHVFESEGSQGTRRECRKAYRKGWVKGFRAPYNQLTDCN